MKKNIVFIRLQNFPPSSSIDMYYYIKYLSKLDKYFIDVITGNSKAKIHFDNVNIHYTNLEQNNNIKIFILFLYKSIKLLHKIKKEKKIDYVYFFSMNPLSVIIQFYSKYILNIKTIYDVTSGPVGNSLFSKISYFTIKFGIFLSDRFILDDRGLYKKLNLKTNKKYTDIGIGYDHDIFKEKKGLNLFNKKENDVIFTYIGNLNRERNLDVFIKAFIENLKNNKNIKLFLIGGGTNELYLNKLSGKYLNNNIFFLGKKEHKRIPDYINSSDILVSYIPKVDYFEHQPPTKLIEYLSCNKPVIATNTIAQENILKGYDFLIHEDDFSSTTDKIKYFINNIDNLKNKNYSSIVENYTWEKLVNKLYLYISN